MIFLSGWSFIRVIFCGVIFHQGDLLSGWSFIRVIPLGWSSIRVVFYQFVCIRVVFHWGGLSSGWSFCLSSGWSNIRVVFREGDPSTGWSSIRLVFLSSSGWSFIMVIFHEGDPSVEWSSNSIRQVFQQGFLCTNYSLCLAVDSLTSGCGLTTVHAAISCIIALGLDGEHMCFIVARVCCSSLPLEKK